MSRSNTKTGTDDDETCVEVRVDLLTVVVEVRGKGSVGTDSS